MDRNPSTITICETDRFLVALKFADCFDVDIDQYRNIIWHDKKGMTHHLLAPHNTLVHISEIPLDEMGVLPGSVEHT